MDRNVYYVSQAKTFLVVTRMRENFAEQSGIYEPFPRPISIEFLWLRGV